MSALARRWGYVVVAAGLVVTWIMWAVVGVHSVDEQPVLPELPAGSPDGVSGSGAFAGVIVTPVEPSTGALAAAAIIGACLVIAMVVLHRRRATTPFIATMLATVALVVTGDAVRQTRDPLLVARPFPLTVMVVASLIAFAAACVLLVDALRGRPPRVEG